MFSILDLFQIVYEALDGVSLRHPAVRGYKSAWRLKRKIGDGSVDLLLAEISKAGFQDEVKQPYSATVEEAVRNWVIGASPKDARKAIRKVSRS